MYLLFILPKKRDDQKYGSSLFKGNKQVMVWLDDEGLGRNTIGEKDVWGRNMRQINDTESEDKLRRFILALSSITTHAHCH